MNSFPLFDNLNITEYPMVYGYYTLGIFLQHRQDIEPIYIRMNANNAGYCGHDEENYDWLEPQINAALANGKIVCLILWDENVMFLRNRQLEQILNKYANDRLYLITQIEEPANDVYKVPHKWQGYHLLKCKIIELPWWLLNDCLTYYRVADRTPHTYTYSQKNYLSMVGNAWYEHKFNLLRQLVKYNLQNYGILTAQQQSDIPEDLVNYCIPNEAPPYQNCNPQYAKMAAQVMVGDTWISKNVENYMYIQNRYSDVPLIMNSETVMIKLFATEKSIWPILLGKLFLTYGRPRIMQYVQRFYDVDISSYANLDFDAVEGYSYESQILRAMTMIEKNHNLIRDCSGMHASLQPQLEAARWTFGKNMYNYFVSQIEKIV